MTHFPNNRFTKELKPKCDDLGAMQNFYYPNSNMHDVQEQPKLAQSEPDSFLEDLVHQKGRIFKTKLEVLAFEMAARLEIRLHNLDRMERDKSKAEKMLWEVIRAANYLMREHRDKEFFYGRIFDLETEKRKEEVECWRDIVMVMRDFLTAWELHEHARARARFIENV